MRLHDPAHTALCKSALHSTIVFHLPAACFYAQILAVEPQEHLRHAVVAVREDVGEVLAAFDCVLGDAHASRHGARASDLQVRRVAAAAVASSVEVEAVAGGGG
jgi:hypothetical protein